jgi:diguanylate cyclase (GGDEF)-like protein
VGATDETWLDTSFHVGAGEDAGPLARLLRDRALRTVFQPIVDLATGDIHAHEALVRGPHGMPLQSPDALFAAARKEGLLLQFELACVAVALRTWAELGQRTRLFVNVSAKALMQAVRQRSIQSTVADIVALGLAPERLTLEITEHEHVADYDALLASVKALRSEGFSIALDDFGDGRSSLRLWSELAPEVVKIDKYFTRDVPRHARKLQTVRALMQIAEVFGSSLVAEGIETADELRVVRDLGISLGQGYFLGRPQPTPRSAVERAAGEVIGDTRIAVLPSMRAASTAGCDLEILHIDAIGPQTSNDDVAALFDAHPEWPAIPVVDAGVPLALIERHRFLDRYAHGYFKEIFGRKPAAGFANTSPRLVDRDKEIAELVTVLTSRDQRFLTDGFIVTLNGRYHGIGKAEQLVRRVTEARIEAARHANPLTFLPGNVPIVEHVERLLKSGGGFVAAYFDLRDFKPFNDYYGYWRGDEMIKLVATTMRQHCDPQRDFVGHVGGDDFVVLFQSDAWEARCRLIIDEFNARAVTLYDEAARLSGGIHAADRDGAERWYPFARLYVGAVRFEPGESSSPDAVAAAAARAKLAAKGAARGLVVHVRGEPRESSSEAAAGR